jgi:F-type H+-transporting ATPase subunit delta
VDVSEPASISSGIAERYAAAIFDILQENDNLSGLETSVETLAEALAESEDLRATISSPLISRSDQEASIVAVSKKLGLVDALSNALALMAQKRRLFVLPHLVDQLRAKIADHKGEVTAEVVTAKAMTKAQSEKLAAALKTSIGKDVKINAAVDKDLIGGLIVKVGSKMIDTSIRSKLSSLQNAMKEVG